MVRDAFDTPVMVPTPELPTLLFGSVKLGWFRALTASARIANANRSPKWKVFEADRSMSNRCGPNSVFLPTSPKVPLPCWAGVSKAAVLNQHFSVPTAAPFGQEPEVGETPAIGLATKLPACE